MSDSWQALTDFVSANNIDRGEDGRCIFRADVNIQGKQNVVEETDVLISFENGDGNPVRITPAGDLTTDRFHTEFNPRYQEIRSAGKLLTIAGDSSKMGKYSVTIQPAR